MEGGDVAHHLHGLVEGAVLVVLGERVLLQVVVLDEAARGQRWGVQRGASTVSRRCAALPDPDKQSPPQAVHGVGSGRLCPSSCNEPFHNLGHTPYPPLPSHVPARPAVPREAGTRTGPSPARSCPSPPARPCPPAARSRSAHPPSAAPRGTPCAAARTRGRTCRRRAPGTWCTWSRR